jgi:disulfide bond formation protein DsbB
MVHSADRWLIALGLGAGAALGGALLLQYVFGFAPCHLCLFERYPYLVVLAACGLGLRLGHFRLALAVAAVTLAANVGLAGYHVGVEQGWLALPDSCAAVGQANTIEELKAQLAHAPARCDQIPLTVAGLSLAAWNGLYAAALLALCPMALLRRPRLAAEQDRDLGAA